MVAKLAEPEVVVCASLATAAVLALRERPDDAVSIGVATPLAFAITKVLKRAYHEHRPTLFDSHPEQSFPSGHSACVTAFALSSAGAAGGWALPFAFGAVVAINVSRVLRREHWPHDVAWADMIGIGCAVAATAISRLVRQRRQRRATMPA
jgi:membrane-associated phospholipid phosphatase